MSEDLIDRIIALCEPPRDEWTFEAIKHLAEETRTSNAGKPELLQACKDVREAYQQMFDVMPVAFQTYDHILASAIAKAEGVQP